MNKIDSLLMKVPRKEYAVLPTPVYELNLLSDISGCNVFCKRDDLTGIAFGGNKARKLDFLIADAIENKSDTLIATGANQSNFCRMVAAYGTANNMEVHLVLGGEKPETPTGNLKLDYLLGANIHHINSEKWDDWERESERIAVELSLKGKSVYKMPVGGSTPIGTLGYVDAMSEIIKDEQRLGIEFDVIVFASSSAGTQSGLVVGKAISGWKGEIIGISVAKSKREFEAEVFDLSVKTAKRFNVLIDKKMVVVEDSYLGEKYGARTKECENAVFYFARNFGIFLDYVYSGKAGAGLIAYLNSNKFKPNTNILFLHTGGNIELFA